jgi:hypothetical protein
MKKTLLIIAITGFAPFAWAQIAETSTTTTTTDASGTITDFTPGSAIVLKEESGPVHYKFGKTTTYVTKSGKAISEDEVATRVKVGLPVHVHYAKDGDDMIVDRVTVSDD